ncbi:MAG: transporter [Deltaproteobacteria bacterium]|nr:transporter [Deltaproteobacteria bacterium]
MIGLWGIGCGRVCADSVMMINGDHLSGRLLYLSETALHISTLHSGKMRIDRRYIRQLITDHEAVIELVSGERLVGMIGPGSENTVVIRSKLLGSCSLSFDRIRTIHPFSAQTPPAPTEKTPELAEGMSDRHDETGPGMALSDIRGRGEESPAVSGSLKTKPDGKKQELKRIGPRPKEEEDIRKIFLRQTSVLLRQGQKEVEIGFNYMRNQSLSSIMNARFRRLYMPLAFRLGIVEGIESFLTAPFNYAEQEMAFAGDSVKERKSGLGDTTAGINFEIVRETASRPEIIAALSFNAPTGGTPQETGVSLGSGHWAGTLGMQFIKTVDPVALFWGLHYTHEFSSRHFLNDGVYKVQPGEIFGYNFGLGFAVNENISLSTQLSGSYEGETKADEQKIAGSSSEPVSLRWAVTYRSSQNMFIEPSVTAGLNEDTADFVLGVSAFRRF